MAAPPLVLSSYPLVFSPVRKRIGKGTGLHVPEGLKASNGEEARVLLGTATPAEKERAQVRGVLIDMGIATKEVYDTLHVGPVGYLLLLEQISPQLYSFYQTNFENPSINHFSNLHAAASAYGESFIREALWVARLWAWNKFVRSEEGKQFNASLATFMNSVPPAVYSHLKGEAREIAIVSYFESIYRDHKDQAAAMEIAHAAAAAAPPSAVAAPKRERVKPTVNPGAKPKGTSPARVAAPKNASVAAAAPPSSSGLSFSKVPDSLAEFDFGSTPVRDMYVKPEDVRDTKELKKGGNGVVYLVKIGGKRYIMKGSIQPHSRLRDDYDIMWTEVKFMVECASPHVIHFDAWTMEGGRFFILMEFMEGGDLGKWIYKGYGNYKDYSPSERAVLIYGMIQGLYALHSRFVVHRDLKPGNIFMGRDGLFAKIGDLGNCIQLRSANGIVGIPGYGTPAWNPPEQGYGAEEYYNTKVLIPGAGNFGLPADVYALGIMIMEIFSHINQGGVAPKRWCAAPSKEWKDAVVASMTPFPLAFSEAAACVDDNPSKRPTMAHLRTAGEKVWSETAPSHAPRGLPESDEDRKRDLADRQKRKQQLEEVKKIQRRG